MVEVQWPGCSTHLRLEVFRPCMEENKEAKKFRILVRVVDMMLLGVTVRGLRKKEGMEKLTWK